ncbi:alpha-galactosidase [Streptomyces sp. CB01635]|uniref:NPCBM/NEW2 domain-containing protein n=1 Tax=unclassified Streptomyces TaxID=2593676 RepID=UPI000C27B99C|nr:NPCBM/NEW2 domain-containing protein [Streptomyces sp. CB01635]PJN06375.1 alpha-galactosidase [Streptomyces sp. CB01635]
MKRILTAVFAAALLAPWLIAAPAGAQNAAEPAAVPLAQTPPMGWNSWNAVGCGVNEKLITDTADRFDALGLKDLGYEYVNIDDCWDLKQRDADGRLVADPAKFPRGLKWLSDYVHERGLKLGIYGDAGTATCAGYPGGLGHEKNDAQQYADWGIDYIKYDNCNNQGLPAQDRYRAMGDAIAATGRNMLFNLCEWGANKPWEWATSVGGHSWRTTGDITDDWDSVKSIVRANLALADYAGPGHWNDPDMLQVGNGGMSDFEYRTHFGMWAMMASPLLLGTDLSTASDATLNLIRNRELTAIDQDPLGRQARVVTETGGRYVLAKPLADGSVAVGLYNENDYTATITTTAAATGVRTAGSYALRDVFTADALRSRGPIEASVPARGLVIYKVRPARAGDTSTPARTFGVDAPLLYDGAPASLVTPGESAAVRTRLADQGSRPLREASVRLDAPEGWRVEPAGRTSAARVTGSRPLATDWRLTPPKDLKPGTYELDATTRYRLDGRTVSDTSTTHVTVADVVPAGDSYLSDTTWVKSTNGWGPMERDMTNGDQAQGDGTPLTIGGTVYPKGLGTHAWSEAVYYTAGHCSTLKAEVGVDDSQDNVGAQRGTVTFEVWKDRTKAVDTGKLSWQGKAVPLDVDVSGSQFVRLVATTADDGNGNDHADWGGLKVTCP